MTISNKQRRELGLSPVSKEPPATDLDNLTVTNAMQELLLPLVEELEKACVKNRPHGNQTLGEGHLLLALFLAFFNPQMTTLRDIEMASSGPAGESWIGLRTPRSTLADSLACFDPELLRPLIDDLVKRLPAGDSRNQEILGMAKRIIAVDGSFFNLAHDVAWAISQRPGGKRGAKVARMNLMLDCTTGTPEGVSISGKGEAESAALRKRLASDAVYVCDRGFYSHQLIRDAVDAGADFVIRVKSNTQTEGVKQNAVDAADKAAGIKEDRWVTLPQWHGSGRPPGLREVVAEVPHRDGGISEVRLLTTLKSPAARIIATLYGRRWQVELFFRWLKVNANYRHLFSHSERGVQWQLYSAVLATLAMSVQMGRKPGKHTLNAIRMSFRHDATVMVKLLGIARKMEDQMARDSMLRRERLARRKREAEVASAAAGKKAKKAK